MTFRCHNEYICSKCEVVCCAGLLSPSMYLGIFEAEVTHVVVDQAESKASVHDGQAPLKKEIMVSTHTAEVWKIPRKTEIFLDLVKNPKNRAVIISFTKGSKTF